MTRVVILLVALAAPTFGVEPGAGPRAPARTPASGPGAAHRPSAGFGVDLVVPVPTEEHERHHFFDGRPHHVLPHGVVVNRDAWVCDAHRRGFRTEADFLRHLREMHGVRAETAADDVVATADGVLHFVGK